MQGADRKNGKKYTEAEIYEEAVAGYRPEEQACPKCFALGQLVPHGSYERNIVYERDGETTYSRLTVRRYKCKSCGATHALLPDILVPYSAYSVLFKLRVLQAYFGGKETIVGISESYGIAVSTVYAWKVQFMEDKELLLGVLSSVGTGESAAIGSLLGSDDLSGTLRCFFRRFGFAFLSGGRKTTRSVPP